MGAKVSCPNLQENGACARSHFHNRKNNKFAHQSGSQVNTEQRSAQSSSSRAAASSNSGVVSIHSYNASGSQPEPLAHRDSPAKRQEKIARILPEPAEQSNIQEDTACLRGKDVVSDKEVGFREENYFSDEEDVCPTCLEEYTPENPKIVTKCLHQFHLSCIYEWMERSYTCPICQKLMEFQD